jgi:hypothetical protein
MTIVIIVLAVILVLGSALWVLPSPREKSQMAMRREAMLKGLQVKLTKVKDLECPGEELHCIAYRLARKREQGLKAQAWMLYRHAEGDEELQVPGWSYDLSEGKYRFKNVPEISALLNALPADVIAVQCTGAALSVYWNERGEIENVTTILDVLSSFQRL